MIAMAMVESEPFPIHSYSMSEVKEAVATRRAVKYAAADINLSGPKGSQLESILGKVEFIVNRMEDVHRYWVKDKIKLLEGYLTKLNQSNDTGKRSLGGNWFEDVREAYLGGLVVTVTQEYRFLKTEPGGLAKLKDADYIQKMVLGYSFDFFRTLRVCEKLGIGPNLAIKVAKLAYRLNPNKLIELSAKYPEVDGSIIKEAVVYSSDSEGFLERVVKGEQRSF